MKNARRTKQKPGDAGNTPINTNERFRYALARLAGGTELGQPLCGRFGGRYLEAILAFRPEMDEDRVCRLLQLIHGWAFDQSWELQGLSTPVEQFGELLIDGHVEIGNFSEPFVT